MTTTITGATGVSRVQDGVVSSHLLYTKLTTNQSIVSGSGTFETVAFNQVDIDTASDYSNSTYKWTPSTAGYYWVSTNVTGGAGVFKNLSVRLMKNTGVLNTATIYFQNNEADDLSTTTNAVVHMNGSTDYLYVKARVYDSASSSELVLGDYEGHSATFLTGFLIRGDV